MAQDSSPAAGGWTVVAEGLNAPRGLAFGADGTLYVLEQGAGGDQCMDVVGPEGPTTACVGMTAAISAVKDGALEAAVSGLHSIVMGQEVLGISDFVMTADGGFVVVTNLGGGPEAREQMGPLGPVAGILASAAADGTLTPIADLAQWEADNNPDAADPGSSVDSNPYGLALTADGSYLVADAGGNDVLTIGADGAITLSGLLHAQFVPAPPDPTASPDPAASPAMMPMQAVPTSAIVGPDGAIYVSQLTGFPFPMGGSTIWRIEEGGEPTAYGTGLTNVMDLAFGPDGTLYAVELAHNGLLSGDITGALVSIPAGGGAATVLATDGLMMPGGIAVDAMGTVFVANGSQMPGGGSIVSWAPAM
jgi:DNA-binding beta-propeller fold protein YncE